MTSTTLPGESESRPCFSVLILDRDAQRCRDRLTGMAKSGRVRWAEAAESIEAWLGRGPTAVPDVLLMSADTFSDEEVSEASASLEQVHPDARLVVADLPSDGDAFHPAALAAWGCVMEGETFSQLLETVSRAAVGRLTLSGQRLGQVMLQLQELIRLRPSAPPGAGALAPSPLTPREREILGLMANRLSNREIAAALYLETGTVKNHVHSVLKKLRLQNRQQAVYFRSREVAVPPLPSAEAER